MGPKPKGESAEDKKARLRERRLTGLERDRATQQTAQGLTTDLMSVYGRPSLFSMSA
jgi:hypothetical protein